MKLLNSDGYSYAPIYDDKSVLSAVVLEIPTKCKDVDCWLKFLCTDTWRVHECFDSFLLIKNLLPDAMIQKVYVSEKIHTIGGKEFISLRDMLSMTRRIKDLIPRRNRDKYVNDMINELEKTVISYTRGAIRQFIKQCEEGSARDLAILKKTLMEIDEIMHKADNSPVKQQCH